MTKEIFFEQKCYYELRAIISVQLQLLTDFGYQKPIVRDCAREAIRDAGKCIALIQGMKELRMFFDFYSNRPLEQRIMNHAFQYIESYTNYTFGEDEKDEGWFWDPKIHDPDWDFHQKWWQLPKPLPPSRKSAI
jgi:hypothetical protein